MPEPSWLTYVGVVTGIVGTITAIAGAVMGYVSYRRISRLKALDLRLELRTREADIREALGGLPQLLNKANDSRFAVAAAIGTLRTGAMEVWKEQVKADLTAVRELENGLHRSNDNYARLTHRELEDKLVDAHRLLAVVNQYAEKYRAELAADDRERDRIRNAMQNRS